jgi:hypothetical protein
MFTAWRKHPVIHSMRKTGIHFAGLHIPPGAYIMHTRTCIDREHTERGYYLNEIPKRCLYHCLDEL